jgi:hypothetical protein
MQIKSPVFADSSLLSSEYQNCVKHERTGVDAAKVSANRPVRLAYQPPAANSTFLSEQTSQQQSASSTFLSEQASTSHQPNEQECVYQLLSLFNCPESGHVIRTCIGTHLFFFSNMHWALLITSHVVYQR